MKTIILIQLLFPLVAFAEPKNEIAKETIKFNGKQVTVGTNESENGDIVSRILIWEGKRKVADIENRSCNPLRPTSGKKMNNRFLTVVKLNEKNNLDYLYCLEEPNMYSYQGLIIGPDQNGKINVLYNGPARGELKDYDSDGLLDFLKAGGRGEPVNDTDGSYDPYLVHRQIHTSDKIDFVIDEELSKKYSQSMGYQWHGSKYNEKIIVNQKTGKHVK